MEWVDDGWFKQAHLASLDSGWVRLHIDCTLINCAQVKPAITTHTQGDIIIYKTYAKPASTPPLCVHGHRVELEKLPIVGIYQWKEMYQQGGRGRRTLFHCYSTPQRVTISERPSVEPHPSVVNDISVYLSVDLDTTKVK